MLKVENLCKEYERFKLSNVSFELPKGYILGFIGMNGAGKSTTMKAMLNLIKPSGGKVTVLGRDFYANEIELKQDIGFMLGEAGYYQRKDGNSVKEAYRRFFNKWDEGEFERLIRQFDIDLNKKLREMSTGMRVKFALALAMAHNARLLVLDEPTSGLDPIARDELLDIFKGIIESGERSILFSTHITSDLDKCADFILFIRNGKIILNGTKDDIINSHTLAAGAASALTDGLKSRLIGVKSNSYGFSGLALKKNLLDTDKVERGMPNLEDVMIFYNRAEGDN